MTKSHRLDLTSQGKVGFEMGTSAYSGLTLFDSVSKNIADEGSG